MIDWLIDWLNEVLHRTGNVSILRRENRISNRKPKQKEIMNRTVAVIKSNATDSEHSQSNWNSCSTYFVYSIFFTYFSSSGRSNT